MPDSDEGEHSSQVTHLGEVLRLNISPNDIWTRMVVPWMVLFFVMRKPIIPTSASE